MHGESKVASILSQAEIIHAERTAQYGDYVARHRELGRIWSALIARKMQIQIKDLPPDLVMLMMASMKIVRCIDAEDCMDDVFDLINYAAMSVAGRTHTHGNST